MSTSLKNKRNSRDTFLPIFQAVVRRLRVGFRICVCVLLQVASSFGQNDKNVPAGEEDRSALKPAGVQLQWSDTDQLDGQLLRYRDGLIQLESPLFKTRIGVLAGLVDKVRFIHRSDARANLGPHRLLLVDGSVLVGNYVSTEAGRLRFDDYRFGELAMDVAAVAKIETNSKVGYAWNGEIKPWQIQSGTWTIDGEQRLHASQSDSKLWLPFPLSESFSIEFEIVSQQSLDLVLATGQDPEKSYRLAKIGESWVVGTSDDFEIVEALSDRQRQLALRLSRSASTGKLTLMQGDRTLVTVSDKKEASDRSGILLQNAGHSLSLKSLRIVDNEEESTKIALPSLAASVVEPAPRSQDLLTFRDGSKLWCTIQDYSESKLKILVNQLAIESSCSVDHIASITPRTKEGSVSLGVENNEYRLQQGQSKLFGSFQLRFDPPTVDWHSSKLDQRVSLNTELPFSMQSQNRIAQAIAGAAQTSEVAYLKSGAKIPVKLERANATQTSLKIPFSTSSVHVDNRALQAIDFWPKKKKASFTKESREMLLSVPRNLEVDHYSHALVGQNGDLLRGNLVAITEQTIEIDSRQEPLGVERRFVDTLLFLHPATEQSRDSRAIDSSSGDTKATQSFGSQSFTGQLSLQLDDGYSISGSWIGGDANTIVVNSPELGECRVETKSIQNYLFNLPPLSIVKTWHRWLGVQSNLLHLVGKFRLPSNLLQRLIHLSEHQLRIYRCPTAMVKR